VPKPFPEEFREDVVRVARSRPAGVSIEQIARGFGIHQTTLNTWLRGADTEDGPARLPHRTCCGRTAT
jgi:transposase